MKLHQLKAFVTAFLISAFSLAARAQSDAPRRSDQSLLRGVDYMQMGQNDQAEACFKQALAENPSNDAAHYYLGFIYARKNDAEATLKEFSTAYAMDSTNVWYAKRYATICAALSDQKTAAKVYEKLLQGHGTDLEVLSSLSDIYMDTGEFTKAGALLDRIEALQGSSDYTRIVRLDILRMQGDFNGYFSGLNNYFADPMVYPEAKKQLFERQIQSGDPRFNYSHLADYDKLIQTCLNVHAGDTLITHLAASYYYSTRNAPKMVALYHDNPRDVQLAHLAIYVNQQSGNYRQALACCRDLEALCTGNRQAMSDAVSVEGDCWQALGRFGRASACYEKAIKLNPENVSALNNYAYFMSCRGKKLKRCLEMSAKVIEAEPENVTYLDTYGWILYKMKRYGEARNIFKKIMSLGGKESVEILKHYADVLSALGETALADGYRQQAKLKENGGR